MPHIEGVLQMATISLVFEADFLLLDIVERIQPFLGAHGQGAVDH